MKMGSAMFSNLVEGASNKTEPGLRAILFAQAKLRILLAVPVVMGELFLFLVAPHMIAGWPLALIGIYCAYILAAYLLARYLVTMPARYLLVSTAMLDPLAISAWLMVTGNEYGSLLVGFYLFTILGFGFRTGRPLMHLCQITTIASFVLVYFVAPYWQRHPVVWISLLVPLIVVPMYAGELIKTLREARDHAERESKAKSELLAKVSHELRTPLTGIISAAELLASESNGEAVAKRTDTILALSNELLEEINDLLDEAKYGANALELTVAPVDLNDQLALLRNAMEAMAAKKGLVFRAEMDPAIEDRVQSDAHRLGRVLLNLAGNAVKFTDRGSVRLGIELLEAKPVEYRLRFSVADTGIGIPKAFQSRLFEPFSQVDQGASRRYGGTGLGLSLSKQIVELMGGELRFESVAGQGSRFWFDLTLRRSTPQPAIVGEPSVVGVVEPLRRKRILVAEDNETNLLLLQELLEMDGHEVTTCPSGMAALELLVEREFDLLLLDYNLGDMDGVRVLQTYRFGRTSPAPALFLTADATQLTASRLQAAGGAGVIYKPVRLAELRKAITETGVLRADEKAASEPFPAPASVQSKPPRPALAAVPISPLDASTIDELRTVSVRPEFFPRLLAEAENDISRNCRHIVEALGRKNHAGVRDAAHALKGVSANVGALRLVALANGLMTVSREELDAGRDRWALDIRQAQDLTVAALRKATAGMRVGTSDGPASLHLD